MKPIDPADQLFLFIERRQQPMHVAGLQLFSLPEGAGSEYILELVEQARSYRRPTSPFNKHIVSRLGMPFWEEDSELDLDLHLRHWSLPQPGRIRELLSLVSAEHSIPLDRERPLWEVHVIEGLSGGRFAIYTKSHHALMDGVSLMRLAMKSLSAEPSERDMPPLWAQPRRRRNRDADASFAYFARRRASTLPPCPRSRATPSRSPCGRTRIPRASPCSGPRAPS